jgi:hypothetical protein
MFLVEPTMFDHTELGWPSGDCKPVIATRRSPAELVAAMETQVFRDREDLDWFVRCTGARKTELVNIFTSILSSSVTSQNAHS